MGRCRVFATLVVALIVGTFLSPQETRAQNGIDPKSGFVYGTVQPTSRLCSFSFVRSNALSMMSQTHLLSFTPTIDQKKIHYIQLTAYPLEKFYAHIVKGGVGTSNPTTTLIALTSLYAEGLNVEATIYCGA